MAGRLTLWGAGQLLQTMFSRSAEPPEDYYLCLIRKVAPTPFVSGSEIDEPIGMGYTRLQIPNNGVYWSNASQLQVTTMVETLTFNTATDDWGLIKFWALANAPAEGMLYATGSLETAQDVPNGEAVQVNADDLAISLGPFYAEEN